MEAINSEDNISSPDEISISELLIKITSVIKYIASKWMTVLFFSIGGAGLGLAYSLYKQPVYSALCTFVLEDGGKSNSSLGQYAGLASLAGIDITGSSGIFQGDNIIELYKSRLMIEKTLLTKAYFNGKSELLINRYIEFNHLRVKIKKDENLEAITFYDDPGKFNRYQDSVVTEIVETINKKSLSVYKPDKKLSIIDVRFLSKDELFAKIFANRLVETVNNFYVSTKTKKSDQNVQVLQHQADSVRQILNSSITDVANANDAAPNANPMLQVLRVPSQKKQVDVQASAAVYSEIVKNLEISRINLREEKPLIQIIDSPVLPLPNDRLNKIVGIVLGFICGTIFIVCYLLLKKFLRSFK